MATLLADVERNVNPARAGMIRSWRCFRSMRASKPRASGDDPLTLEGVLDAFA